MTDAGNKGFGTGRRLFSATVFAIILIGGVMWYVQATIEKQYRENLSNTLTTILGDVHSSVRLWYRERESDARIWASHPDVVAGAEELLRLPLVKHSLVSSPAQQHLRKLLEPVLETRGFNGFFVISTESMNLASTRDSNIGEQTLLANQRIFISKLLSGNTAISLPQHSDVPLPDKTGNPVMGLPTMFVGAPVENSEGDVIALLAFRIDPEKVFYPIIQRGRMGETGETYAFNSDGILLNHSRFDKKLRQIGLLKDGESSALNIHIRDHGRKLKPGDILEVDPRFMPLTRMAISATSGQSGMDIEGYPDYRGVKVVGAWRWNGRAGFGLTTEQDFDEAYAPLIRFRFLAAGSTLFIVLLLAGLAGILHKGNKRMAESATRFRAVFDHVVDGLITIDEHGMVETMNPAAENIFGYKAKEVIGKNVKMLMPSQYADNHDQYLANFLRTEEAKIIGVSRELLGRRKNGDIFPIELGVSEVQLYGRRLFLGAVSDISLRKKGEEELRASEASLANAQSIANLGSWSLNLKNNDLVWSDEIFRIFGLKPQEFAASYEAFIERVHPDDAGMVQDAVEKSLNEGAPYRLEHRIVRPDGDMRHVLELGEVTYDDEGNPEYMTGVVQDISEQKKVDRMKSEFVSTVSHELRTPLTSIHGSLGLLVGGAAGDFSSQAKSLLEIAHKSSDRLIRLINDILDAEKLEADRMNFDMQSHNVNALIDKAIVANMAYAEQFEVEFVLNAQIENATVITDADRFEQIMTNLMSNAAKFSPKGSQVILSVERQEKHILISVTDQGVGIPKAFHDRLFEKFAQADSSDTRKISGTGLGLSIFKKLVERMGGDVGFVSEEGKGSTFHFTLPDAGVGKAASQYQDLNIPAGPRVLICEDDQDIAQLLLIMLEQEGIACDVAYTAAEAKRMLLDGEYDAMTLDLVLPDMDGISLMKELRAKPETQNLPIVVVSAKAEEGKKEVMGDAFGIVDWLTKPLNAEHLKTAVRQAANAELQGRPKILHVEDDDDIVQVVSVLLRDIADVQGVATLEEAKMQIKSGSFDLVILDIGLPDGSGVELLSSLDARDGKSVPVLVFSADDVSSDISREVAAALVKSKTSNEKLIETKKLVMSGQLS